VIYNSFSIQRVYFNREERKGFYKVMATIRTFTKGEKERKKKEKIFHHLMMRGLGLGIPFSNFGI
jgi:hypothetical protein